MHSSLPTAILLDLDDTILDDSGTTVAAWQQACAVHESELGAVSAAAAFEAIDRVRHWYWADPERHREGRLDLWAARRKITELALAELGVEGSGLAVRIGNTYSAAREAGVSPLVGAIETVRWLRTCGCRLALITNGAAAPQRRKIERFGLAQLFEHILIEGELGFGKPDVRVYQRALEHLSVEPSDAWMVGDNLEWDVAQPQNLGIYSIWIDVAGAGLPADSPVRPDRIIRSLSELIRAPA